MSARMVMTGKLTPMRDTLELEVDRPMPIGPTRAELTTDVCSHHGRLATLNLLTAEAVQRFGYRPWITH